MPDFQPPGDGPGPLRIAPHLDLEHTKLTSTGLEEGAPKNEPAAAGRARRRSEPRPGSAGRTVPLDDGPASAQRTNRTLWFLALAAAVLIVGMFLKEVADQTGSGAGESTGLSAGSAMMDGAEKLPATPPED